MSKPKQEQKQTAPEVSGQREQERPSLPTQIAVRAYPVSDMGQVLANLSVDVNGCFAIRGAKLVQGKNGPFVSMPQRKVGEEYKDIVFTTTREMYDKLNATAIAAYGQAMDAMAEKHRQAQQTAASAPTGPTMAM